MAIENILLNFPKYLSILPLRHLISTRLTTVKWWLLSSLFAGWVGLTGCAHNHAISQPPAITATQAVIASAPVTPAVTPSAIPVTIPVAVRAEQIRTACIQGRRLICGRVLMVATNGLVVDSGYTNLLRSPLGQSWVIPGTVSASRDPHLLELNNPGSLCAGLVFLTDVPKRQKVKKFDYVVLMGYPAGQYDYKPMPEVSKILRKFAAGLDSAVKLNLKAETNSVSNASPPTHS